MPSPDNKIDLSQIGFPTDKVTIGDIRRHQPDFFVGAFGENTQRKFLSNLHVFATLSVEQVLAERAYAAAAGLPDPHPLDSSGAMFTRQEGVWMLNDDYQRYGLTTGLHQTRQLVRNIERAAASQAKKNSI